MRLKTKDNWGNLFERLHLLKTKVPEHGAKLMVQAAQEMDSEVRSHLKKQGRGGAPPPLSDMTRHIYSIKGEPDGSGVEDAMEVVVMKRGHDFTAVFGIPDGKPTMIIKVQNEGASIHVTDKMRGFLAANYGIFLRASTTVIVIPGRDVWNEPWQLTKESFERRIKDFFSDALNN